ncbi:MAG: HAMP domain-containing protein [Deltaproteobacteria bacterium]|nr:HAMP domain-containing protein [Deltaproteobacteria bacterium]
MKMKLAYKIFLAFLVTSILAVVLMVGTMRFYVFLNFADYVNQTILDRLGALTAELSDEYQAHSGWVRLTANPGRWNALVQSTLSQAEPDRLGAQPPETAVRKFRPARIQNFLLRISRGLALFDADKQMVAGGLSDSAPDHYTLQEITVDGRVVGWIGLHKRQQMSDPLVVAFFKNQSIAFYVVGAGILILAGLASFLLSKHFLAPVRQLADGTKSLAGFNFDTRIDVNTNDEIGQLAADFNRMAQTLQNYETIRRQWISDISHELRTPLAVLRGEIEALQDGVRAVNTGTLKSLHSEIIRLSKLVEDLHQLSMADSQCLLMQKESVAPLAVLAEMVTHFRSRFERKRISVSLEVSEKKAVSIIGDADRLAQLFSNILENSLNYTDSPGALKIYENCEANQLTICFEDSAPGVPEKALERLFDRLYRVDRSRNRERGGSGLGLAICKQIVESHGGKITAAPAAIGGLLIRIELPLNEANA